LEITYLEKKYLDEVVGIHQKSLPYDFLPLLGRDFLKNVFYDFVLTDVNSRCLVCVDNGKCIGFSLLTLDSGNFLRIIISRYFFRIGYYFLKSAIKDPGIIPFAIGLFFSITHNDKEVSNFAEIYEIAVDEGARGSGVGDALVRKSIAVASSENLNGIKIKTLKSNKNWISYFLRKNWKISKEIIVFKNTYVVLEKSFIK